jgi:hypothetical protein
MLCDDCGRKNIRKFFLGLSAIFDLKQENEPIIRDIVDIAVNLSNLIARFHNYIFFNEIVHYIISEVLREECEEIKVDIEKMMRYIASGLKGKTSFGRLDGTMGILKDLGLIRYNLKYISFYVKCDGIMKSLKTMYDSGIPKEIIVGTAVGLFWMGGIAKMYEYIHKRNNIPAGDFPIGLSRIYIKDRRNAIQLPRTINSAIICLIKTLEETRTETIDLEEVDIRFGKKIEPKMYYSKIFPWILELDFWKLVENKHFSITDWNSTKGVEKLTQIGEIGFPI